MEKQSPTTGKFAFHYGLLLGSISIIFAMVLYFKDLYASQNPALIGVSIVLAAVVTFWGIAKFKKAQEGFLALGQALKMGMGIALISAFMGILYHILLIHLDPETASKIVEAQLGAALESGRITPEQFSEQKTQHLKFWWRGYPLILILHTLMGLVLGLITGLLLQRPKPA